MGDFLMYGWMVSGFWNIFVTAVNTALIAVLLFLLVRFLLKK